MSNLPGVERVERPWRTCGLRHTGPCPAETIRSVASEPTHGVECYEAWRNDQECPHDQEQEG